MNSKRSDWLNSDSALDVLAGTIRSKIAASLGVPESMLAKRIDIKKLLALDERGRGHLFTDGRRMQLAYPAIGGKLVTDRRAQ